MRRGIWQQLCSTFADDQTATRCRSYMTNHPCHWSWVFITMQWSSARRASLGDINIMVARFGQFTYKIHILQPLTSAAAMMMHCICICDTEKCMMLRRSCSDRWETHPHLWPLWSAWQSQFSREASQPESDPDFNLNTRGNQSRCSHSHQSHTHKLTTTPGWPGDGLHHDASSFSTRVLAVV